MTSSFGSPPPRTPCYRPAMSSPTAPLPRRLEALLALAGRSACLADVGTDHALLPAHAVLRGVCERALAVDLRAEPLVRARENLVALGVDARVTVVRGDGLAALADHPFEVVVMAGLSGRTMLAWCHAAPEVVRRAQRIVVQPNGDLPALRAWAHDAGLWLVDEVITHERGRWFVSCAFEPRVGDDPAYTELELSLEEAFELGPWLVRRRVEEAGAYYAHQARRLGALVAEGRMEHAPLHATYRLGVARVGSVTADTLPENERLS